MSSRLLLSVLGAAVVALAAFLYFTDEDERYAVNIVLADAGGLRTGANVRIDGAPVGSVSELELGDDDRAHAEIRLDPSVAPIGKGARVVVQADGLFGERYVDLQRGDVSKPQPDGSTIPLERATVSTRLDDVIDTLDADTRSSLKQFFNEQGTLIVGRGRRLSEVLAALPPSLGETGRLLDQLGADQLALASLIESSDRVVAEVADNRGDFGRVIGEASRTFAALDSRRTELGQTLDEAPSTLRSAQRVLVALRDAAVPLAPAADGLRRTSPALAQTLRDLPAFADAAIPTFAGLERVAPDLKRLGTGATPTVRRLSVLARELNTYTRDGLNPFTDLLEKATPNLFGLMEGWARSTQGFDSVSRIFRFGATTGTDTFAALLSQLPAAKGEARKPAAGGTKRPASKAPAPARPERPKAPQLGGKDIVPPVVQDLLDDLTGATGKALDGAQQGRPNDVVKGLLNGLGGKR